MLNLVLCFLAGLIVGALILHLRARARELELRERTVRLETERDHLKRSGQEQRETFKALAGDVLKDSVEQLGRINRTVLDTSPSKRSTARSRRWKRSARGRTPTWCA